jgi:hypothetical protein
MNKYFLLPLLTLPLMLACPNNTPTADQVDQQRQESMQAQATAELGMPAITHFREKRIFKMIMEYCDQEIPTFVYSHSEMTGKFVYVGEAVGMPIPYATEYTNPQKIGYASQWGIGILPQADPNGLFKPSSANGTFIMMKNPADGALHPVYLEPNMTVSPFKLPARCVQD